MCVCYFCIYLSTPYHILNKKNKQKQRVKRTCMNRKKLHI